LALNAAQFRYSLIFECTNLFWVFFMGGDSKFFSGREMRSMLNAGQLALAERQIQRAGQNLKTILINRIIIFNSRRGCLGERAQYLIIIIPNHHSPSDLEVVKCALRSLLMSSA
jgi:phosphoglucomutase